jgi:hypothetical protein
MAIPNSIRHPSRQVNQTFVLSTPFCRHGYCVSGLEVSQRWAYNKDGTKSQLHSFLTSTVLLQIASDVFGVLQRWRLLGLNTACTTQHFRCSASTKLNPVKLQNQVLHLRSFNKLNRSILTAPHPQRQACISSIAKSSCCCAAPINWNSSSSPLHGRKLKPLDVARSNVAIKLNLKNPLDVARSSVAVKLNYNNRWMSQDQMWLLS